MRGKKSYGAFSPSLTQLALPSSLPASGARSCGEDVNWDWNNKQSEPLRHLEMTKEEAAEGTWI